MTSDTTSSSPTAEFVPPGPGQWMLDTTHHGRRPGTRFMRTIADGASDGFETLTARFGLPLETMEFANVHGYVYARPKAIGDNGKGGAPPPRPIMWLVARLHPELRRRNRTARQAWVERRWREDVDDWFDRGGRSGVLSENLRFQAFDPAGASDDALAAHVEELADHLAEQFVLGFATHGGDIVPCGDYLAHCAGWGITAAEATPLLSGSSPLTVETRDLLAPAARALAAARDAALHRLPSPSSAPARHRQQRRSTAGSNFTAGGSSTATTSTVPHSTNSPTSSGGSSLPSTPTPTPRRPIRRRCVSGFRPISERCSTNCSPRPDTGFAFATTTSDCA